MKAAVTNIGPKEITHSDTQKPFRVIGMPENTMG
jgi:hypothetical protein